MTFSAEALRDRVAIVTGAGQGIGRAIAVELASMAYYVKLTEVGGHGRSDRVRIPRMLPIFPSSTEDHLVEASREIRGATP